MTKGLGKLQQGILDHITTKGGEARPQELARVLFDTDQPTRAQLVSIRRAMQSLNNRGLAQVDKLSVSRGADRLSIRLPEHPAAEMRLLEQAAAEMGSMGLRIKRTSWTLVYQHHTGEQYRDAIIETLNELPQRDDYKYYITFDADYGTWCTGEPYSIDPAVLYKRLKWLVLEKLGIPESNGMITIALSRAIKRLAKDGKINAYYDIRNNRVLYVALS